MHDHGLRKCIGHECKLSDDFTALYWFIARCGGFNCVQHDFLFKMIHNVAVFALF